MRTVLIIGATSAIAEATGRLYAQAGDKLFLLGRDGARLQAIAADLRLRGAASVDMAELDVQAIDRHDAALNAAWQYLGQVELVLLAHGVLPDQAICEHSVQQTLQALSVNAVATIALMVSLGERLELQQHGCLAVIGSVAGDRGRASNYVYGCAKAAIEVFASGLRQRLQTKGVNVLLIKPGFVDTPMTRNFRKNALWTRPEKIAKGIAKAVEHRRSVVYLPGFWRVIMFVIRHIPETVFKRIPL